MITKKELIEEIKKINSIITWRNCYDSWHRDYHKVLADANTAMKSLLNKINKEKIMKNIENGNLQEILYARP